VLDVVLPLPEDTKGRATAGMIARARRGHLASSRISAMFTRENSLAPPMPPV
jgi:hypothetical protein